MNKDDEVRRQAQADREYQRQYAAWLESLTPDERRQLRADGLDKADVSRRVSKGKEKLWKADEMAGSDGETDLVVEDARQLVQEVIDEVGQSQFIGIVFELMPQSDAADVKNEVARAFRAFIAEFARKENPHLELHCIARAADMAMPELPTVQAIADRYGIRKQTVHKKEKEWRELLGLPRASHQKSAAASKSYVLHNRRRRAVPRGRNFHV